MLWSSGWLRPVMSGVREVIGMLKKVLTWGGIIFVIYYLATSPSGAAHFVHGAFNWLHSAGNSMSKFVNSL
jgi:hypothetical protein